MDPQSARARGTSLTCLGVHDHACLFDGLEAERLELASAFLRIGLARGERCLYAGDENTAGRIMPCLRAAGVDVGQALASGALAVDAPRSLEPGEVFASLEARIEAALGDGYTALRIVGPATWTLARGFGLEKWIEVEEELKRLFGERQLVGIWQYGRSGSSPGLLRTFLRMHPFVIVGGEVHPNCLFVPPGRPAGTGRAPDELDRALDAVLERARADDALGRHVEQLHLALGAHALWEWDAESDRVALEPRWAELSDIELAAAGRFTARVAHEINNPLAWITTNLGFMKEVLQRFAGASAPPSPEEVSQVLEALQETEEGASRIREFVETLPGASSWRDRSRAVPRDVRAEILGAVGKARDRILSRARMTVSVPERLPLVVTHEGALGKVFLNLLLGAAHAIPEGSPEDNEIRLAAYLHGERLFVEITDSGVGMSLPMREHMFDLFLANEPNKSPESAAGLFLSRAVVQRYGGSIEVESAPARGTTVRVLLPVSSEDVVPP